MDILVRTDGDPRGNDYKYVPGPPPGPDLDVVFLITTTSIGGLIGASVGWHMGGPFPAGVLAIVGAIVGFVVGGLLKILAEAIFVVIILIVLITLCAGAQALYDGNRAAPQADSAIERAPPCLTPAGE